MTAAMHINIYYC